MIGSTSNAAWNAVLGQISRSVNTDFATRFKLAGLDPAKHARYADWDDVDFGGSDLNGFDFTGARLSRCKFANASIVGARFEHALIDIAPPYAKLDPARTNLRAAKDWQAYAKAWQPATNRPRDDKLSPNAVFQDAPFAPEMVVIPAGKFTMGSPLNEPGRPKVEKGIDREQQHEVTISKPFAVGRFSVTFDEWQFFADARKRKMPNDENWGMGRRPVIYVRWDDAEAYVGWLRFRTGLHYRLLSEAEWEYCCRGGRNSPFGTGDRIDKYQARFIESGARGTVDVGTFPSNAWGIYDMHGNVYEWCEDVFHDTYDGAPDDGKPWLDGGEANSRVVRGGSWLNYSPVLRSAFRLGYNSDDQSNSVGFRLARTLEL